MMLKTVPSGAMFWQLSQTGHRSQEKEQGHTRQTWACVGKVWFGVRSGRAYPHFLAPKYVRQTTGGSTGGTVFCDSRKPLHIKQLQFSRDGLENRCGLIPTGGGYGYDQYGRINSIDAGATRVQFTYDYVNKENNIWKKNFAHRGTGIYNEYTYDDIDRVTRADYLVNHLTNVYEAPSGYSTRRTG